MGQEQEARGKRRVTKEGVVRKEGRVEETTLDMITHPPSPPRPPQNKKKNRRRREGRNAHDILVLNLRLLELVLQLHSTRINDWYGRGLMPRETSWLLLLLLPELPLLFFFMVSGKAAEKGGGSGNGGGVRSNKGLSYNGDCCGPCD